MGYGKAVLYFYEKLFPFPEKKKTKLYQFSQIFMRIAQHLSYSAITVQAKVQPEQKIMCF